MNVIASPIASSLLVYVDTSALRGMSFSKDVACLLAISKQRKAKVFLSETTLWERGRQQYQNDFKADRVVPFPDGINRYIAWFKVLFEKNLVEIIPSDDKIVERCNFYLEDVSSYFNPQKENDKRDAHVLATAEIYVDKSAVILCDDTNLSKTFEAIGLFQNIRKDYKEFLKETIGNEGEVAQIDKPSLDHLDDYIISKTFSSSFQKFIVAADHRYHEYEKTLPTVTDKLSAKLANMQALDAEIRKRLLGYTQWFSPVPKEALYKMLEHKSYSKEQLENNALRLKQADLLIETDKFWLTNKEQQESREVCDQAMSLVMPEILEIMELA